MTEEKAKQLLEKYLSGKASVQEHQQVEDWYAQLAAQKSPVNQEQKLAIRAQLFSNLQTAIANQELKKTVLHHQWLKIAATIIAVISTSLFLWKLNDRHHNESTQITISTLAGERKKITLSDGSVITLSPLAKISYPNKFNAGSRAISLSEGEAFFSIAHDEKRPFYIQLPAHLKVTVLGTSFGIKAYKAKEEVEIAVATGKVAVSSNNKLLGTLVKNQKLQFSKVTGKSAISSASHLNSVPIEFNGATLQQVIQKLEYVYSIKILLNNKALSNLKCTATFNSAQHPADILDIICSLHHIKLSSDKNHQTFKIYK